MTTDPIPLTTTRDESALSPIEGARPRSRSTRRGAWVGRFIRRKPLGAASALVLLGLMLWSAAAPLFGASDPLMIDGRAALQSPSLDHVFGTDNLGRDVYSRVAYGGRVSLTVGFGAVAISLALATAIGVSSAYIGGWYDAILQRIVDAIMALPGLVLLLMLVALFGGGLWQVMFGIGLLAAFGASRVLRSSALSVSTSDYILAAHALGARDSWIMFRHILPNLIGPMMVIATLGLGSAVLAEASLSFLGFGVPEPHPSWGNMISGYGRQYLYQAPWMAIAPGIALTLAVFAFNALGDAVRDAIDPRMRGT
ncbi:MAG: ABC transporter permease [Dehalococcoidia bacterium]|nr:ABC transporter permease [Dehalococcoidia bacterium]